MPGVSTEDKLYKKYARKWKRTRDAVEGEDAVQAGGTAYLPRLKDQSMGEYRAYVERAGFFNATWRTIDGLTGMILRKPPKMEVPAKIKPYLKDVTLSGVSFEAFYKCVLLEDTTIGRVGILVDHPPAPEDNGVPYTQDRAEQDAFRPTMQIYFAESIIRASKRRVGNQTKLALVVLCETIVEAGPTEFDEVEKVIYRVLDLDKEGFYRQRVFEVKSGQDIQIGGEVYPIKDNGKMRDIPFVIMNIDGTDGAYDDPPLYDVVGVNLKHYAVTADYEHACHFTALPTPVISGATTNPATDKPGSKKREYYIGSTTAWLLTDPSAKAYFLEFTGAGLEELRLNRQDKERQMAILGARMLMEDKRAVETDDSLKIKRSGETSILAKIAIAVSTGIRQALVWYCEWAGETVTDDTLQFELNRDFLPMTIDPQRLTSLIAGLQSGVLDKEDVFELLQRGDMIKPDKTIEEQQAKVALDQSLVPPTGGNAQVPGKKPPK